MSANSDRVALGVANGAVAALARGGVPQSQAFPAAGADHSARTTAVAAADLRAAVSRALTTVNAASGTLVIAVGSDLARHWIQDVPRGVSSLEELKLIATLRFSQLYGEAADRWQIAGDWRAGTSFLCAAIPRWVTEGCDAAMAPRRRLASVQTSLGLTINSRRLRWPRTGWWCVASPTTTAVGNSVDGLPGTLRCVLSSGASTPSDDDDPGLRLARQESARAGDARLHELFWVDLRPRVTNKHRPLAGVRITRTSLVDPTAQGPSAHDAVHAEAWAAAQLALDQGAAS